MHMRIERATLSNVSTAVFQRLNASQ
jgi:hypothetical protein